MNHPSFILFAAAAVLAAYAGLLAGCTTTQSREGRDLNAVIANDRLCGVIGSCK